MYSQSDNANCSEVCQDNCTPCPNCFPTYPCPFGCLEPNSNIKWPPVETAVWYIVADFLPLLFVIPIILLFNINLAFGPGHCLVFSYQILGCYVTYSVSNPYLGNPVNLIYSGILNIFGFMVFHNPVLEAVAVPSSWTINPPPNPTPNPYSFPMLILSYIKVVLAILYFVSILFLVSRSQFPFERGSISWSKLRRTLRRFREKHAYEGSVLVGTTSVLILIFGYVVEISFNLLSMGGNNECTCNCGSSVLINPYHRALAGYNSQSFPINIATDFIGYGSLYIAIPVISLLLLLFSSLALIYYPAIQNVFYYVCKCNCPRLTKLDPVIDVLQGGYKLRLRFFAGIYLLYRILIWSIWAFVIDASVTIYTYLCYNHYLTGAFNLSTISTEETQLL